MLITFKSSASANITLFGEPAKQLLEMMEFGVSVPGAIRPEDVAAALKNLVLALNKIPKLTANEQVDQDDEPAVGIHSRALPLIKLLEAAESEESYVRWE